MSDQTVEKFQLELTKTLLERDHFKDLLEELKGDIGPRVYKLKAELNEALKQKAHAEKRIRDLRAQNNQLVVQNGKLKVERNDLKKRYRQNLETISVLEKELAYERGDPGCPNQRAEAAEAEVRELKKKLEWFTPEPYVAANLREALKLVPDTGDWHGQLRHWCDNTLAKELYAPNRTAEQMKADYMAQNISDAVVSLRESYDAVLEEKDREIVAARHDAQQYKEAAESYEKLYAEAMGGEKWREATRTALEQQEAEITALKKSLAVLGKDLLEAQQRADRMQQANNETLEERRALREVLAVAEKASFHLSTDTSVWEDLLAALKRARAASPLAPKISEKDSL